MISSPCVNICKMDAANGLCLGCLRTIEEITVWSRVDDAAKLDILAAVAKRRPAYDSGAGKKCGNDHHD